MARRPRPPLNVYLNGRIVGQLHRSSSGAIDFRYDQSWLDWPRAIPVSLSLPLREDRYIGAPVAAVFENLLPDNLDIRRRVAERSHAHGSDAYSLLAAIGRDCVGALQFIPDGIEVEPPGPIDARPVSDEEVAAIFADPFLAEIAALLPDLEPMHRTLFQGAVRDAAMGRRRSA